jgi:predicted component of type VI protein secretion system
MAPRVLYRDAQGRTGEVALDPETTCYIGRALDCAVRTDDAMVSRKHSLIRVEGGRFVVEDLGSSNGTHVNDIKVSKQALNHNDVVRCGNLWLRYIDDGPPEAAPGEALAGGGSSSKFRSTLGGSGEVQAEDRARAGRPTDTPPGLVAETVRRGPDQPPPTAPRKPRTTEEPPAPSPPRVIRPDGGGRPLPLRPQSPHAVPIAARAPGAVAAVPAEWETDPAGSMPRDEMERRLDTVVARAREIERGLLTLQAELEAAQQKVRALLAGVQELTAIKE